MKISLPIILVICLIGFAQAWPTDDSSSQLRTKLICEESEFTDEKLSERDLDTIKLVKMKNCLSSRKKMIDDEEENKHRQARSTDEEDSTPFEEIFKNSDAFKRVLSQFLKLRDNIVEKTENLEKDINKALKEYTKENDMSDKSELPNRPAGPLKRDTKLSCSDKPKQVIHIKKAVLSSIQHERMCEKVSERLPISIQSMNETCYNQEEATKRLSDICDGDAECDVSITLFFSTICDCTTKKHLEVEYTCEPETEETKNKRSKRALYYQNLRQNRNELQRFTNQILNLYDYLGPFNYYYDYYGNCLYDVFSPFYYDYCYNYYYNYFPYPYYYGYGYFPYPYGYYGYYGPFGPYYDGPFDYYDFPYQTFDFGPNGNPNGPRPGVRQGIATLAGSKTEAESLKKAKETVKKLAAPKKQNPNLSLHYAKGNRQVGGGRQQGARVGAGAQKLKANRKQQPAAGNRRLSGTRKI